MQTKLSKYMDTKECGLSPNLVLVMKRFEVSETKVSEHAQEPRVLDIVQVR
jgi:hypothetical protein